MATKVSFNTGDDVLKVVEVDEKSTKINVELDIYFQVDQCTDFVSSNNYQTIALQFPNNLIEYSQYMATKLAQLTNAKYFVLADTSYGPCCVDEVAAAHINADALIHFGHTCLSSTQNLPVLYVFGKDLIDMSNLIQEMKNLFINSMEHILLFYSVEYYYSLKENIVELTANFQNLVFSDINSTSSQKEDANCLFGRTYKLNTDSEKYQIMFIGTECVTLRNLMLRLNRNKFITYNPVSSKLRRETLDVNKSLMRRYYLIEKAKDAQIVGIVMGTLGVKRYKEMVDRLKEVLKHADKKFYTFIVGKVNVPKMANFMEIDIFVLVACPENSLIDSKEYYKPIITPYEMEIACLHTKEWTGDYITDFQQLLPGSAFHTEIEDESEDQEPEFSFITGQLRKKVSVSDDNPQVSEGTVQLRNNETQLVSQQPTTALEYLSTRTWQGLTTDAGKTEVKKAGIGREGIAMEYTHEQSTEE